MAEHYNPLAIVEDFFGEELGKSIEDTAEKMPFEQVEALRDRMTDAILAENQAITSGEMPPYPEARPYELHGNESVLGPLEADITEVPSFRHMLLYCDHIAVTDPLLYFPNSIPAKRELLVAGLKRMAPIANLVRTGTVELIREGTYWEDGWEPFVNRRLRDWLPYDRDEFARILEQTGGHAANLSAHTLDDAVIMALPPDRIRRGFALHGIRDPEDENPDELFASIMRTYQSPHSGPHADVRDPQNILALKRLMGFEGLIQDHALTPFTSNPALVHYYRYGVRPLRDRRRPKVLPTGRAINYQVPSLGNVAFEDIVRLRDQVDIFPELRDGLGRLSTTCADYLYQHNMAEDSGEHAVMLADYAAEITQPLFNKLRRIYLGAAFRNLVAQAGVKAATLGLSGIVELVASAAELGGGEKLIGRKSARRRDAARTAMGIVKSISE